MQQYRFGPWTFDSETGSLSDHQSEMSLDPKIASLLHLFLQHPGKLFSRDELLDIIWKGSIVNDNSVSWAISQLRKSLNDEAKSPKYLETLPKKGYRFLAEVKLVQIQSATPNTSTVEPIKWLNLKFLVPVIILVAVITLVTVTLFKPENSPTSEIVNPQLLTVMDGAEKSPQVSQDGLMMVFLHRPPQASNFNIWLKPLKENRQFNETTDDGEVLPDKVNSSRDVPPRLLLQNDFSYEQVIWGQDAYNLFAVQVDKRSQTSPPSCQIVQLKLDLARTSVVQIAEPAECYSNASVRISYDSSSDTLYFTDRRNDDSNMSLYSHEFSSGTTEKRLAAENPGRGIHFVNYNPHNNKILYLQDLDWRRTRFGTYDLSNNSHDTIFELDSIYYSAWWGVDPNTIWLNWGNQNVLEYHLTSGESNFILQSSFGWNFNLKPIKSAATTNKTVLFEVSDASGADFTSFREQQWRTEQTGYTESSAAYGQKTGKLAYISNQNGLQQVWLKGSQYEMAEQLTNVTEFREIQYLSWSSDETKIVGISENVVGLLDLESLVYKGLVNNNLAPYWPTLSPDNEHILVTHNIDDQWRLYRYPVTDKPIKDTELSPYLLTEGFLGHFIDDGTLLFSRFDQKGLFLLNIEDKTETLIWSELPAGVYWQIHREQLIYGDNDVLRSLPMPEQLRPSINQISAKPVNITVIPDGLSRAFDIHPLTGEVLFLDYRQTPSNIKRATWQRK